MKKTENYRAVPSCAGCQIWIGNRFVGELRISNKRVLAEILCSLQNEDPESLLSDTEEDWTEDKQLNLF